MLDGERMFRSALDEPAPPDPPETEPERDDDGGHQHHWIAVPLPVFAIYSDGTLVGNGWAGTFLQGWWWLGSFVTMALALWAAWSWLPYALLAFGLALVLCFGWIVLGGIAEIERQHLARWWASRRRSQP